MKYVVGSLIVLLMILHQDFWNWHRNDPLVFGFIPIGLAWHAGISLSAAFIGWLAARFCWPIDIDMDMEQETAPPPTRQINPFDH